MQYNWLGFEGLEEGSLVGINVSQSREGSAKVKPGGDKENRGIGWWCCSVLSEMMLPVCGSSSISPSSSEISSDSGTGWGWWFRFWLPWSASKRLLSKWSNVGSRSGGRGVSSLDGDSKLGPWIVVKGEWGRAGGGWGVGRWVCMVRCLIAVVVMVFGPGGEGVLRGVAKKSAVRERVGGRAVFRSGWLGDITKNLW
jgi:hypothetical protein